MAHAARALRFDPVAVAAETRHAQPPPSEKLLGLDPSAEASAAEPASAVELASVVASGALASG
jgi:hypothetical protein